MEDKMVEAEAEVGNTAIEPCGAPFLLLLHCRWMTQQASNNKGSTANVRKIM